MCSTRHAWYGMGKFTCSSGQKTQSVNMPVRRASDWPSNLVIAEHLDESASIELLYCGDAWQVLARCPAASADAAKALAAQRFAGIAQHWLPLQGTREEALLHYDLSNEKSRCSFCGKRAFQVALLIEGANGIVCNECVARFRRATQSN